MNRLKGFEVIRPEPEFHKEVKTKRTRRKTISDKLITDDIIKKLAIKCAALNTRREIVLKLLELNLSNAAMARVINNTIPYAQATGNSVAAIVNQIRKENSEVDNLLQDMEDLF